MSQSIPEIEDFLNRIYDTNDEWFYDTLTPDSKNDIPAAQALSQLIAKREVEARIDELKHIDDPNNVYVYWEGLKRPLDRIKELESL